MLAASFACALLLAGSNVPVSANVQTLTGNYNYTNRDIQFADSPHLFFERTYNSIDNRPGPVGLGWVHNFNIRLAHITNGPPDDLIFVGPMGRQDDFAARGDGTFQPSPTALGTLVENIGETDGVRYTLTYYDGVVYHFGRSGYPTEVAYPDGDVLQFIRNMNGTVSSVVDNKRGRILSFAYDVNKRLTTVQGSGNFPPPIRYEYDDLGRLSDVVDRVGQTTHYTYYGDTAKLHEMVDARGHVEIANEYDEQGRTSAQQTARWHERGMTSHLIYATLADGRVQSTGTFPSSGFAPESLTTMIDTYDDQQRIATHETRLGPNDEPLVEVYGNNAAGKWGVVSHSGGHTTPSMPAATCLSTARVPGLPVEIAVGQVVGPSPTHPTDPAQVASFRVRVADDRAVARSRDTMGRLTTLVFGNAGQDSQYWHIDYDNADRLASIEVQDAAGGTSMAYQYQYDEVGNLIESAEASGAANQYEYDENNDLVMTHASDGLETHYEYDNRSEVSRVRLVSADGEEIQAIEYKHDGLRRLRQIIDHGNPASGIAPSTTELGYDAMMVTAICQQSDGDNTPIIVDGKPTA
jgi:YD repeat-containing protein